MPRIILLFILILLASFVFGQQTFRPTAAYTAQSSRAYGYYMDKKYLQSGLSYDTLFKISKGKGTKSDKYNAACSWALAGNKDRAFYYLDKAASEDNFTNLSHLLSDADLTILHKDERWSSLVEKVKVNKEKVDAKLNKPLVAILDTIYIEDQSHRHRLDTIAKQFGWESKQMDSLLRKMQYHDSINLVKVKKIIDSYGWLGPDQVGEEGASTLLLVIQDVDSLTQVAYARKMREAVKKGKARPQNLALLEDRILTTQGKEQIYGSQVRRNQQTGKFEFFPIRDEVNVNKRRAAVGLQPLEEYAKFFEIEYTPPKIKKPN